MGRSPDRESSVLARLEQVKTVRVLARLEQVKTVRVLATCAAELRRCSPRWQDSGGVHLREWWQDSGGVHRPESWQDLAFTIGASPGLRPDSPPHSGARAVRVGLQR